MTPSQVEYYDRSSRTCQAACWPRHAIVERTGDRFRLDVSVATLTKPERAKLATQCQEAMGMFKAARGATWEHRRPGLGIIPGPRLLDAVLVGQSEPNVPGAQAEYVAEFMDGPPGFADGLDEISCSSEACPAA